MNLFDDLKKGTATVLQMTSIINGLINQKCMLEIKVQNNVTQPFILYPHLTAGHHW